LSAGTAPVLCASVVHELNTTAADCLRVDHAEAARVLSVVVPTLNEAPNIGPFLRALHGILSAALDDAFEIIVVDDDSPDGTALLAAEAARDLPFVRVCRRRAEQGLASAVIRGWQASGGELLATINADFQHPPELLSTMLAVAGRADLVVASRYCAAGDCGDWGISRRLASRAALLAGRAIAPDVFRGVSDPLSGCYLVRRAAIAGIEFRPTGYKTLIEILARARPRHIVECGYSFHKRRAGRSKASLTAAGCYLRHLGRLRQIRREA
jgi:dolichol-phosphate mannosyltransferase